MDDTENPASTLASHAPSQVDKQDEMHTTLEVQQDFEPKNRRKNYKWDKTDHEWLMDIAHQITRIRLEFVMNR